MDVPAASSAEGRNLATSPPVATTQPHAHMTYLREARPLEVSEEEGQGVQIHFVEAVTHDQPERFGKRSRQRQ